MNVRQGLRTSGYLGALSLPSALLAGYGLDDIPILDNPERLKQFQKHNTQVRTFPGRLWHSMLYSSKSATAWKTG